jgi:rhodanese-related sulfurtransferase
MMASGGRPSALLRGYHCSPMSPSPVNQSSPTSYGVSPVIIMQGEHDNFHRQSLTTSSATTPVFSPTYLKEDDQASSLRTLDNVRDQVAGGVAVRMVRKLKTADNTQYGVTMTQKNNAGFLRLIASHLASQPPAALKEKSYLVAVATTGAGDTSLLICGTDPSKVQRAALLAMSKFIGHIKPLPEQEGGPETVWLGRVRGLAWNGYDEAALMDVLQKCAQELVDPSSPPPGSRGIDEILALARTRLHRLLPRQAFEELRDADITVPVLLVDIRPAAQRAMHGQIPGAMIIERNVLEWRFDPRYLEGRLDIATRFDLRIIIFCQAGYTSSLAAASLQDVGLLNATDVVGGFEAWKEEGLPIELE